MSWTAAQVRAAGNGLSGHAGPEVPEQRARILGQQIARSLPPLVLERIAHPVVVHGQVGPYPASDALPAFVKILDVDERVDESRVFHSGAVGPTTPALQQRTPRVVPFDEQFYLWPYKSMLLA